MNRRGAPSARRLRAYLADALQEIRTTGLLSSAVAWDDVDREARTVLDAADRYADTHTFLTAVLKQAGGRHSHLTPPPGSAASRQRNARVAEALGPPTPTGHLVDQASTAVADLRLPRLPEGRTIARRYLADGTAVMSTLTTARPRGWIVDLRANIGGGMWPMLAVAAPLLPEGILGHSLLPDNRTPIAVLTSRHTASAGEAVALAFRAQPRARRRPDPRRRPPRRQQPGHRVEHRPDLDTPPIRSW
jgi:carboxyl-terminal processing protease